MQDKWERTVRRQDSEQRLLLLRLSGQQASWWVPGCGGGEHWGVRCAGWRRRALWDTGTTMDGQGEPQGEGLTRGRTGLIWVCRKRRHLVGVSKALADQN